MKPRSRVEERLKERLSAEEWELAQALLALPVSRIRAWIEGRVKELDEEV